MEPVVYNVALVLVSSCVRYRANFEVSVSEKKENRERGGKILHVPNRRVQIMFVAEHLLRLLNNAHLFSTMSVSEGKWWGPICIMST